MALQDCPPLLCCSRQAPPHLSGLLSIPALSPSPQAAVRQGGQQVHTVTWKPSWFSTFPTNPNPLLSQLLPSLQLHAELGQAVMIAHPPEESLPAQNHLITISEADSPSPHVRPYFLTQTATCARVTLVPELLELGTKAGKSWGEHNIVRTAIILLSMQGQMFRFKPGDYQLNLGHT